MAMFKKISLRALLLITIVAVYLLYCPNVNSELCSILVDCGGGVYIFCAAWGDCEGWGCMSGSGYVYCFCTTGQYTDSIGVNCPQAQ
jgi:hypothetical protein